MQTYVPSPDRAYSFFIAGLSGVISLFSGFKYLCKSLSQQPGSEFPALVEADSRLFLREVFLCEELGGYPCCDGLFVLTVAVELVKVFFNEGGGEGAGLESLGCASAS
jgi:hypothetical protein